MKRTYTSPKLIPIGDMVNNTLGASGTFADNGTRQANGQQRTNSAGNNRGRNDTGFNNDNFTNDGGARQPTVYL